MHVTEFRKLATAKKSVKHEESILQQQVVKAFYDDPRNAKYWLFSIKNSSKMGGKQITAKNGKKIPLEAIIAKREGVRAGAADLCLLVPNKEYHGFFIECKVGNNGQSDAQKEFEAYCIEMNYKYSCLRDFDTIMKEIKNYLANL